MHDLLEAVVVVVVVDGKVRTTAEDDAGENLHNSWWNSSLSALVVQCNACD